MCLSSLLFFASFNMIVPELPAYLTSLGGAEYKGFIISLFTITALLSRPFSGKIADRLGRVPVMMAGSIVCFACSLMYPVLTSVAGFLLLRLIHGFSTGFTPTGQTAYLADIVPASKRGEAVGLLGTAGTLGMAGGPAIGGLLANQFGINAMFYCSSAFAILSVIIVANIKETLKEKHPISVALLKISKDDLFEPRVLVPCFIMVLCAYSYGTMLTVIPDFSVHVGIKNKGLLFTYFTVASLVVRLLGGKASDRWGRRAVLRISSLIIAIATLTMAFADSPLQLITGMALYGLGHGATSPTLLAWATDLSNARFKGRGIASLYIFMELGIGLGAFISGFIYGNQSSNFFVTFTVCSSLAALAFLHLTFSRSPVKIPS
ncbi:MFS transporter [Fulvivirgaceae bacterium PWU4]|uniref:MFS transporter n=2 Tax=Chryseosolibacter histidini TaxID=2782349 RepID=A0AAP2DHK4_9BACT|nr:MFS transporter [Chryseosolibacter histidini]